MWMEIGTATWANKHITGLFASASAPERVKIAGYIMMVYGVGGLVAPLVSGFVSDWTGQRKWLIVLSYAVSAPLCVIFGYQTTLAGLTVFAFLMGFTSYIANPQLTVLISQFAGVEWAATANGTANFIFQTASMLVPLVLGFSIDLTGSSAIVWWIMAVGPVVGILLMLPVDPSKTRA